MASTIDTLKLAKRFREAKTDEERAEAFAEGLREVQLAMLAEVATKADVNRVEVRLETFATKVELALAVEKLERRIDRVETRLGRTIIACTAFLGGLFALLRFAFPVLGGP